MLNPECNDEAHGTRVWQVVVWIPTPRALSHPPLDLGQKIPQYGEGGIPLFLCRNYIYCDICIIILVFLFFVGLDSFIQKKGFKVWSRSLILTSWLIACSGQQFSKTFVYLPFVQHKRWPTSLWTQRTPANYRLLIPIVQFFYIIVPKGGC